MAQSAAVLYWIQEPTFWTPTQTHNTQCFGCYSVNKPAAGNGTWSLVNVWATLRAPSMVTACTENLRHRGKWGGKMPWQYPPSSPTLEKPQPALGWTWKLSDSTVSTPRSILAAVHGWIQQPLGNLPTVPLIPLQTEPASAALGSEVIRAVISANKEIQTVGVCSDSSLFVTKKLLSGLAWLAPEAFQRAV